MKNYRDEMDKIRLTEAGKQNLIRRVEYNMKKENSNQSVKFGKIAVTIGVIAVCAVTSIGAIALKSPKDVFSNFMGKDPAQTDIMNNRGTAVGAYDTSDGITIMIDAVIGDKNNVCIVYTMSNEDGSPIVLPEGVKHNDLLFSGGSGSEIFCKDGGINGSLGFEDFDESDGALQIVETINTNFEIKQNQKITAHFENLSYFDGDKMVPISKGKWNIKYNMTYDDSTVKILSNQKFEMNGITYTVNEVSVSPLAVQTVYTVDKIPSWVENPAESGKMSEEMRDETALFLDDIKILINKKNGESIKIETGAAIEACGEKTKVTRGSLYNEIIPIEEIESVTVGDVTIEIK